MTVMPAFRSALVLVLAPLAVAGCSSQVESSGAPPLIICGTTLWSGASGAVVTDATARRVSVTSTSSGDNIYLKLTNDCHDGATISVAETQAKIVTIARSKDGRTAAVALHPRSNRFTVQAHRPNGRSTNVSVSLSAG